MPDDVMRKVNALGKRGARAIERGKITFRNRKGDKFSWENDTFDDLVVDNEEKKIYPDVAAEIPTVPLQEELDSGTKLTNFKDDALSLRARLAKAGANANPTDCKGQKDRGVAQSDQSVVDLTSDESAGEQPSQGVRIKMESEFPTVDPNSADVPTQSTPASEPELGRGRRVRK